MNIKPAAKHGNGLGHSRTTASALARNTCTFRLQLALHTPMVLPDVPPRLDILIHEAMCRVHRSWAREHALPLTFDEDIGGYRASQVVFGTTRDMPMSTHSVTCISRANELARDRVVAPKRRINEGGGGYIRRLTRYHGYLSPYLIFYGEGDPEACGHLLSMLDGVGREHARGSGAFTVTDITPVAGEWWRIRSVAAGTPTSSLPYEAIRARERLLPTGVEVDVLRPPRVIREVVQ